MRWILFLICSLIAAAFFLWMTGLTTVIWYLAYGR